jgi:hypothetical protein
LRETKDTLSPNGKKIGRPRKNEVETRKPTQRGKIGRPKGDAAIINEYKARMLASPKSKKVLDTIMNAALDDDHKHQSAAWKLLMDRMLPISYFEKDKAGGGRAAVNITITGVGGEQTIVASEEEPLEGDYVDYDELDKDD